MQSIRAAVGVIIGLPLYFLQDRLLFIPQRLSRRDTERINLQFSNAEEIHLRATDGTGLHGWLVKPATPQSWPLLIYFGGNMEEVSTYIARQTSLGHCAMLLMNYRGYGLSGGTPSESALCADAIAICDAMQARPDIDTQRIAVMGRSLGSGVAVWLAAHRSVRAVILATPYDSIRNVAQEKYPYVNVARLLKHPFDSLAHLSAVRQHALFLTAESDEVIPIRHARQLYDAWPATKHWVQIRGTDHANISDHPEYWDHVSRFLRKLWD